MKKELLFLIIDDDEDDREIFMVTLQDIAADTKFTFAYNGKDALDKFHTDKQFIPDYIFLDLNMPILNGKETLKEIKKIPRLNRVPVIIYTTSSYPKDIEESKRLGAGYYLIKPSTIDSLSKILSGIIQQKGLPFLLKGDEN